MRITKNDQGRRIGQSHPRSKYTDSFVAEVFRLLDAGVSRKSIAAIMRMKYTTVRAIASGRIRNQVAQRIEETDNGNNG